MKITVREAEDQDIPLLQALSNKLVIDNQQYDDDVVMDWATGDKGKQYFSRYVTDKDCAVLIAFGSHERIAYVAFGPKVIEYRKSKYLEIDSICVSPDYQSKGIGKLLIGKVKDWGKQNGYHKLFVNSYFKNHRAIEFYKRNGFKEIDVALEMEI